MGEQRTEKVGQALRLNRFYMASTGYLACLLLLGVVARMGLVPKEPALHVAAAMVAANVVFFALLRSGLNLRFADPSLTWPQIVAALAVVMFAAYHLDSAAPLALCLIILAFGMFRFDTREFLLAAGVALAGYALVINLRMAFKPETVDVLRDGARWLGLALLLPFFAVLGGRLNALRTRFRPAADQLSAAHARIREMTTHDDLTGLPNLALFHATLARAVANAARNHRGLAVAFLDLDRFKVVNDALGHVAGDRVLEEVARRLSAATRSSDMLARMRGDKFVLLVEELHGPNEAMEVSSRLLAALRPTCVIDGQSLALCASIGVCTYPEGATTAESLVSCAEVAMYRAKDRAPATVCFYSPELNDLSREQLELEAEFSHALEAGQFELHYQPKVYCHGNGVAGLEALVRWRHPARGLLLPGRFIRLAEENGFICRLDLWGVRVACGRIATWKEAGRPLQVAVNISARQFNTPEFAEAVGAILRETGAPGDLLELEITENTLMRDPAHALPVMQRLRELHVVLAIDDFGTGYSSLAYLKRFPIQRLKIDRTFVVDLPDSREDLAITRAIIAMAHTLGMRVTAEGVELDAQFRALHDEGCDEYQGYYCRPPIPEPELEAFLAEFRLPRRPSALVRG